MFGLPFGMLVEGSVAVLLSVSIGYSVVLNNRLKRLHADRDTLRQMVADLVQATELANNAVGELRSTASETELIINARLEEAEKFGIELANHVSAGQAVLERIARITSAVAAHRAAEAPAPEPTLLQSEPSRVQSALQQLASRPRINGSAA